MVSVKIKKQLNLPQLIEWAWENDIWSRQFCISTRTGNKQVSFGKMNEVTAVHNITEDDLFTVEVEEKITENTVLPKLVERWKHDDEGDEAFRYVEHDDKSINRVLFANPESVEATHFYIENDNRELVLIWCDGRLIE